MDVEAGDRAVELMRAAVASTHRPEVVGGLGGFGGAIAIPDGYREPLLVSSTDGVGTKTAIARAMGRYDGLGIDLVAMCADDVVCSGAEPLFFLDYVAVGRIDPERIATIVGGVAAGCRLAGCALVGGETAEHPGTMAPDEVDLAGACTGVVERTRLIDGSTVRAGDAIVGLAAQRPPFQRLLARPIGDRRGGPRPRRQLRSGAPARARRRGGRRGAGGGSCGGPGRRGRPDGATLGDVLLTPTRIYARAVLRLRDELEAAGHDLRGLAHITGGGLPGNVPRALPAGLGARLDPGRWPLPAVMRLMARAAGMDDVELRATFNGASGWSRSSPTMRSTRPSPASRPRASRPGGWARSPRSTRSAAGTRRGRWPAEPRRGDGTPSPSPRPRAGSLSR